MSLPSPYRAAQDAPDAVVIASAGRGAQGLRLVGSVLLLAVTVWGWGAEAISPMLVAASLIVFPYAALITARCVHAWMIPHRIVARPQSLRLAWSQRRWFLPWLRRHDKEIAWSAVGGIETHTYSVNGIRDSALHITVRGQVLEIPDDGFDVRAEVIQGRLLDYRQRDDRPDSAQRRAFTRLCAARFARPSQWCASVVPSVVLSTLALVVPTLFGAVATANNSPVAYGLLFVSVAVLGLVAGLTVRQWWTERWLRLDNRGICLGSSVSGRVVVPWDQLRGVRRVIVNGNTSALELLRERGDNVRIGQRYGVSHEQLAALIDPAEPRVQQACGFVAGGMEPSEAAARAGL